MYKRAIQLYGMYESGDALDAVNDRVDLA